MSGYSLMRNHPMSSYFLPRQSCPACQSDNVRAIYECSYTDDKLQNYLDNAYKTVGPGIEYGYLERASYRLDECGQCELIYQSTIPNDELMEVLYERWIDPQISFERHEQQINTLAYYAKYAQEIMQMLAYFKQIPAQVQVLDAGMGWGKWARMAKAFGCEVYGNELSPARIEYAESHGIKVLSWEEIASHQFDFINADQVFEHLPDPRATIDHLAKALKPKGLLRISVPDGHDIHARLAKTDWSAAKGTKDSLNLVSPLEHINCFNHDSLVRLATNANLQLTTIPLTTQIAHSTNWQLPKEAVKNIVNPLRQRWLHRGTNLLFRHAP